MMWWYQILASILGLLLYYIYRFYAKVRRYPTGPMPYPFVGNLLQLDDINTHKNLERLADKYGPIFTVFLPKPTVIITGQAQLKEALIRQGDIFAGRSSGVVENPIQYYEDGGIFFTEKDTWKEQQRFALHTLRDFGMSRRLMEDKVLLSVSILFDQIDSMAGKGALDLAWRLQLCVGNIINELLLGYHFETDDCDKFIRFTKSLNHLISIFRDRKTTLVIQSYPWMRHLPFIGWWGHGEVRATALILHKFMEEEVAKVKTNINYDIEPDSFVVAYLQELRRLEEAGNTSSYSEQQLVSVLADFWAAGMETTTTTLRWAFLYLIIHPDVKLQREIDEVIGHDRQPTMADKNQMPYTSAVIMELQRCANILPLNAIHKTHADTVVDGHTIPMGTSVLPQISAVMHDPKVFPDPERFDPGRFLEADGVALCKAAVDYLMPFGLGKRMCAGEPLAKMEVFLILTAIMQRYTLAASREEKPLDVTPNYGLTLTPRPYKCLVSLRKSSLID